MKIFLQLIYISFICLLSSCGNIPNRTISFDCKAISPISTAANQTVYVSNDFSGDKSLRDKFKQQLRINGFRVVDDLKNASLGFELICTNTSSKHYEYTHRTSAYASPLKDQYNIHTRSSQAIANSNGRAGSPISNPNYSPNKIYYKKTIQPFKSLTIIASEISVEDEPLPNEKLSKKEIWTGVVLVPLSLWDQNESYYIKRLLDFYGKNFNGELPISQ